ncbi:hypothetical protein DICA4_D25576 [Diutina catenulata]
MRSMTYVDVVELAYPYLDPFMQLRLADVLKECGYTRRAQRLQQVPVAMFIPNSDFGPVKAVDVNQHYQYHDHKVAFYTDNDHMYYFDDPRFANKVTKLSLRRVGRIPKLPQLKKLSYKDTLLQVSDFSALTALEELSLECTIRTNTLKLPPSLRRLACNNFTGRLVWPYRHPPTHLRFKQCEIENFNEFLDGVWTKLEVLVTDQVPQLTAATSRPIALRRLACPHAPERFFRYKTPRLESIYFTAFMLRDAYKVTELQRRRITKVRVKVLEPRSERIPGFAPLDVDFVDAHSFASINAWFSAHAPQVERLKFAVTDYVGYIGDTVTHLEIDGGRRVKEVSIFLPRLKHLRVAGFWGVSKIECYNLLSLNLDDCQVDHTVSVQRALVKATFRKCVVPLFNLPKSLRHLEIDDCPTVEYFAPPNEGSLAQYTSVIGKPWKFTGDVFKIATRDKVPPAVIDAKEIRLKELVSREPPESQTANVKKRQKPVVVVDVLQDLTIAMAEKVAMHRIFSPPALPKRVNSLMLNDVSIPGDYLLRVRFLHFVRFHRVRVEGGVLALSFQVKRLEWEKGTIERITWKRAASLREVRLVSVKSSYPDGKHPHRLQIPAYAVNLAYLRLEGPPSLREGEDYPAKDPRQCAEELVGAYSLAMVWIKGTPFDLVKIRHTLRKRPSSEEPKPKNKRRKRACNRTG